MNDEPHADENLYDKLQERAEDEKPVPESGTQTEPAPEPIGAEAKLNAWFEGEIKNSRYSQNTPIYNEIRSAYLKLRTLLA